MQWHPEDGSDGSKHCVQCVSYTVMTPNGWELRSPALIAGSCAPMMTQY